MSDKSHRSLRSEGLTLANSYFDEPANSTVKHTTMGDGVQELPFNTGSAVCRGGSRALQTGRIAGEALIGGKVMEVTWNALGRASVEGRVQKEGSSA